MIDINKIYNMDALEGLKDLPDNSIDCIIIDPPYSMNMGKGGGGIFNSRKYLKEIFNNDLHNSYDFNLFKNEFVRVLKNMNIFIFCSKEQLKTYLDWIYEEGYLWNLLLWHKNNPTPLVNNTYLPDTEYIFHIWKDIKLNGDYNNKKKFYFINVEKNNIAHPCVKPLKIIRNLIKTGTKPGDLVLDCFIGSGTTAVACQQTGRNFIGFDNNKLYCDIANNRLKQKILSSDLCVYYDKN